MATNARGTHVLQCLIKGITNQAEEDKIIELVRNAGIQHLIKNLNGVHVLIQIVNYIHTSKTEFILE